MPLLIYSPNLKNVNLGTIDGFGVCADTVLSLFGIADRLSDNNIIDKIR